MGIAATGSNELAFEVAKATAQEIAACGLNLIMGLSSLYPSRQNPTQTDEIQVLVWTSLLMLETSHLESEQLAMIHSRSLRTASPS